MLTALVDAEDVHTIIEILEKEQVGLCAVNMVVIKVAYLFLQTNRTKQTGGRWR